MARKRRRGLSWEPEDGWPLDHLFVGVATLRTLRELLRYARRDSTPLRAWDLALRSGVSAQGSANSMERLERLGLVKAFPSGRPGYAPTFAVDRSYPLLSPLDDLFYNEQYLYGLQATIRKARRTDAG